MNSHSLYSRVRSTLSSEKSTFAGVILISLLVRFWDLDARSIWFDESVEFWVANAPLSKLPELGQLYLQPLGYSFLLHLWTRVSSNLIWLRALSVLFSVGSTVGVMLLARRVLSHRSAIITGLLMALLPAEVRYAQDASEYSFLVFGLTWMIYFLDLARERSKWRHWLLWGLFCLIGISAQYGAVIPILATGAYTIFESALIKNWKSLRRQLSVGILSILAGLPLLIYFIKFQFSHFSWIWDQSSSFQISEFGLIFTAFRDSLLFLMTGSPHTHFPGWIGTIVLLLFGIGMVLIFIRSRSSSMKRVIGWFLVTFLLYFLIVSMGIYARGTFGFRYVLILAPLFIISLSVVVRSLKDARIPFSPVVPTIMLLTLFVYNLPNQSISDFTRGTDFPWPENEDLGPVYEFWRSEQANGDHTYIFYGAVPAFRYYRLVHWEEDDPQQFNWLRICWSEFDARTCRVDDLVYGEWVRGDPADQRSQSIFDSFGEHPRHLWLIFSHISGEEDAELLEHLMKEYTLELQSVHTNASAYLLAKK